MSIASGKLQVKLVRGCHDVLPPVSLLRQHVMQKFAQAAALRCCQHIETPILEHRSLYSALGQTSDINQHETFSISESNPEIVLRPEGTAGVARSVAKLLHHSSSSLPYKRVWYAGPMFRKERPQAGRFRQFTQLGVEMLANDSVDDDVDSIQLAHSFLSSLCDVQLRIHSLGTPGERAEFNIQLTQYLQPHFHALSKKAMLHLRSGNALRLLDDLQFVDAAQREIGGSRSVDTTSGGIGRILHNAPRLWDCLSTGSKHRFDDICQALNDLSVPFIVDHTLVRGLDYYTGVTYEIDAVQNDWVVAGGGRYSVDNVDGVGFAIGLERLISLISLTGSCRPDFPPHIPVVALGSVGSLQHFAARRVVDQLRHCNVAAFVQIAHTASKSAKNDSHSSAHLHPLSRPLPKVVSTAAAQQAPAVVVIGSDDIEDGVASVKRLVNALDNGQNSQPPAPSTVPIDQVHLTVKEIVDNSFYKVE